MATQATSHTEKPVSRPKRVISLVPAATEMICALDCARLLVGRSHECDYPPEVLTLPSCTASSLPANGSSVEIDQCLRQELAAGKPLFQIDAGQIRRLRPDLILVQSQCDVCAVDAGQIAALFPGPQQVRPRLVTIEAVSFKQLWADIQRVADALGVREKGRDYVRALKQTCAAIIEKTCVLKSKPRVTCVEWIEPPMFAGNWMPELVQLAGGQNAGGVAGKHSPWCTVADIAALDPHVIIFMPCGFDLERTRREVEPLRNHPDWSRLRAFRKGRVFAVDGNAYFNRPGPRLLDSLLILAEILHPALFDPQHENKGWRRIDT